ncbi:hypothetical protein MPLA_1800156 [Mesorhizobium sp. ORS 3359]|nr:hypothetical protein MPLA_1800156 [Mesorhizobium sp. ORS 3359]
MRLAPLRDMRVSKLERESLFYFCRNICERTEMPLTRCFFWSEWQDLNLRPPRPERGALPDCATLRDQTAGL